MSDRRSLPTAPRPSRRFVWRWKAYLLLLLALLAHNLYLYSTERYLVDRRDRWKEHLHQQAVQAVRLTELVDTVRKIGSAQTSEVRVLKRLFAPVESREQFLVTEGERIVWSLVRFNPRGVRTLLFYVPQGNHRFVYSVNQFEGDGYYARSAAITRGDHRLLDESGFVELRGGTVHELQVAVEPSEGRQVNIRLLGQENITLHDRDFPLAYPARVSLSNLQNDSEKFIAYPNELRTAGDAKSHVSDEKSKPVTAMMTLMIDDLGGRRKESKGRVVMRFWIDSAADGCMADTTVAANYKFLANMKQAFRPASQADFEQTFKPYDGSGRYYFRDGYFPEPIKNDH